ncbi:hypothetical protein GCM10009867_34870 [Pedococcus aerophilus]|uniref:Glycosyltransferase RgtA/B/C/D-like domain-containing protein n=1 Tax=Pedococcus aerophilus TaxID=436356 RepID=A0ABN3UVT9_9MICO
MSGSSPSVPRSARGGWSRLVPLVLVLALLPVLTVRSVADPSPWLHLRVGDFLLDGGRFGQPDPWAPFAAHAYVPTQWLPSVVLAQGYDQFGVAAVVWSRGVAIVALAVGVLWLTRQVSRPVVAVPVTVAAVAAAWGGLAERPQLAGFVLLVVAIGAWWRTGTDHRARWWLVPLTWLTACTHGVWVLGLVVGGLVVLGLGVGREVTWPQWRRLALVLVASFLAAGLTPLGPRLLLTPFQVGSNGREFVSEWFPSSVRSPDVALALVMLGLVYAAWLALRERPPAWQLLPFLVAIAFILTMQRTVAVGAFLAAPLLAEQAEKLVARRRHEVTVPSGSGRPRGLVGPSRREVASWVVGLVLAALVALPLSSARAGTVHAVPVGLSEQLRALPPQTRILAEGDVTGWVLFEAPQTVPVFDLRIESYSGSYITRYIDAMQARPGWGDFVAQGGTRAALLPAQSPLGLALVEQLGWSVVAMADGYQLLEAS